MSYQLIYLALDDACEHVMQVLLDVHYDGIWPGFVCTPESKEEAARATKLLHRAAELMRRCVVRETPRALPYCQMFELEEKHEDGQPISLN